MTFSQRTNCRSRHALLSGMHNVLNSARMTISTPCEHWPCPPGWGVPEKSMNSLPEKAGQNGSVGDRKGGTSSPSPSASPPWHLCTTVQCPEVGRRETWDPAAPLIYARAPPLFIAGKGQGGGAGETYRTRGARETGEGERGPPLPRPLTRITLPGTKTDRSYRPAVHRVICPHRASSAEDLSSI